MFSIMLEMECSVDFFGRIYLEQARLRYSCSGLQLVSTNQTIRRLDFDFLDIVYVHVMEAPAKLVNYFHLAGRVGRTGKRGEAVVLVEGECEWELMRMQRWYQRLQVDRVEGVLTD